MPTPVFTIKADGKDISQNFAGLGITMTITDGTGLKSDSLQIVIDDVDGSVEAPRTGAVLNPIGGYEGRLRDFGLFSVDSVNFTGWPQVITISAKSVAAKSLAKQREPKSYPTKDYPKYGDIFKDIAGKIGLTLKMDPDLEAIANPNEAQTEEDGLQFLGRLGEKINAGVTVKAQNLVVVDRGEGKSASGEELDRIWVAWGDNLLSYSVTESDEPKHGNVTATWYDRKKNKREEHKEKTGLDGPDFLMRKPFQNQNEARRAARSHAKRIKRQQSEAQFEIDGDPFAMAEALVEVSGCRSNVDGVWRAVTVSHQFSSSAPYITSLQCEHPNDDKEPKLKSRDQSAGGGKTRGSGSGSYKETGVPSLTGNSGSTIA